MKIYTSSQVARPDQRFHLKLLSYPKVKSMIDSQLSRYAIGSEKVSVEYVLGRVCAEDVRCRRDIPPLPISAMDGYAIRSADTRKATSSNVVSFEIKGTISPGHAAKKPLVSCFQAYYVATGSTIPQGADTVVRVEKTRFQKNGILLEKEIAKGDDICFKGEDVRSGTVLFERGTVLNSADLALAISSGIRSLRVFKIPRVGILSIGDELRSLNEKDDGRLVNNYANLIQGYASEFGAHATLLGIARDNPKQIGKIILKETKNWDMLITIAGSSVGTNDSILDGLQDAGATIVFHGLRMVPLRPVGLAVLAHKPLAILPGHAVSATLSFFLIVLPILNLLTGLPLEARQPVIKAVMEERLASTRSIDSLHLVQSKRSNDGAITAISLGWGSNLLLNLSKANGFILLRAKEIIEKGSEVSVTLLGGREISRL